MNNAEYWEKRLAKIRDNAVKNEKIKAIYRRAYRTTEKDLKKLYDELADMGELTASKLYRSRRFLTLLDELKKQNGDIKSTLTKRIKTALKQAFKDTYSLAGGKLGKETAWTVQNSKAAETIINTDWSGKHFSKRIWANTNKLSTDIRRKVTDCVIRGTAKDTAIKQIMKSYDTGYNNAYRLVQTEVARTQNAASVERYKEEGVKKAKWVTAHDERVCPHCGAMEGKIFDIDKVPHIMHPRCHCSVDPVVSSIPGMEDIEIHYRDKQEYGKEITENEPAKLTNDEESAIMKYISSKSYTLNEKLRNGTKLEPEERRLVQNLNNALSKMPKYKGTVYRGITDFGIDDVDEFINSHVPGTKIKYPAFTSTSKDKEIYGGDMPIQYVIRSKNGADITKFNPEEQEILFKTDTEFVIIKVVDNTIYLEEV